MSDRRTRDDDAAAPAPAGASAPSPGPADGRRAGPVLLWGCLGLLLALLACLYFLFW